MTGSVSTRKHGFASDFRLLLPLNFWMKSKCFLKDFQSCLNLTCQDLVCIKFSTCSAVKWWNLVWKRLLMVLIVSHLPFIFHWRLPKYIILISHLRFVPHRWIRWSTFASMTIVEKLLILTREKCGYFAFLLIVMREMFSEWMKVRNVFKWHSN